MSEFASLRDLGMDTIAIQLATFVVVAVPGYFLAMTRMDGRDGPVTGQRVRLRRAGIAVRAAGAGAAVAGADASYTISANSANVITCTLVQ